MSQIMNAWMKELERDYGVSPRFTQRLVPLLECLVDPPLLDPQRRALFKAIAAAHQMTLPVETTCSDEPIDESVVRGETNRPEPMEEVRILVGQFIGELRKMEESVKVLGAMLERVREQMTPPRESRVLH